MSKVANFEKKLPRNEKLVPKNKVAPFLWDTVSQLTQASGTQVGPIWHMKWGPGGNPIWHPDDFVSGCLVGPT
jgi:hypothetical protein